MSKKKIKKMRGERVDLFYEYSLNKLQFLENDLVALNNNISVRSADSLDFFELMLAKNKFDTADKIIRDILNLQIFE